MHMYPVEFSSMPWGWLVSDGLARLTQVAWGPHMAVS